MASDQPGFYNGRHYTAYVDEVKALKRAGQLDRAAELLLKLIGATEAEAKAKDYDPAPWYEEQLGIVYRKMAGAYRKKKDLAGEKDVLERYLKYFPSDVKMAERFKETQRDHIRSNFRERFGREAAAGDVEWAILNECRVKHGLEGNWGFYRNTTLQMADQVFLERRLKDALVHYLEVCYLDLNGPRNRGAIDQAWRKKFPPFKPEGASLAPDLITRINEIMAKLSSDKEEIKRLFIEYNGRIGKGLQCPVSPEACWPSLDDALSKKKGEERAF